MRVLVDTVVWSLGLRRWRKDLSPMERALALVLRDLTASGGAILIGVVRQELLSGIADTGHFETIRERLRGFPDEGMEIEDYEEAARCANACRAAGVASSPVDMLLCGMGVRRQMPILTTDKDFALYAAILPIQVPKLAQLQAHLRRSQTFEDE